MLTDLRGGYPVHHPKSTETEHPGGTLMIARPLLVVTGQCTTMPRLIAASGAVQIVLPDPSSFTASAIVRFGVIGWPVMSKLGTVADGTAVTVALRKATALVASTIGLFVGKIIAVL
jgi:hypothetical protein